MPLLDIAEDLGKERQPVFSQDANDRDQSGNAARAESAPGEAEEEDLIAGNVVCRDEAVCMSS